MSKKAIKQLNDSLIDNEVKETKALLKKGTWLTRLFTVHDSGPIEWYIVGVYDTAQAAYFAGNQFVVDNQEMFDEQSDGKVPEHMVIELLTKGGYPDECVDEQFIFGFLPSSDGAYIDSHGVTRGSYMMANN